MVRMLVPAKYRTKCRADIIKLLGDKSFLKDCGEHIIVLLESDGFWSALERRLDFVMYTVLQNEFLGGAMGESFLFRDFDPLSTDALFSLAEEEVKKKLPEPLTIIHDELFCQITSLSSGGMQKRNTEGYDFFVAPYFSGGVILPGKPNGQLWMEQLAEEIFRSAINTLIDEIEQVNQEGF